MSRLPDPEPWGAGLGVTDSEIQILKGRPSYMRCLQPLKKHPAHQNMKILYCALFLCFIFANANPDPQPW
jgi:hypothetical protein